MPSLVFAIDGPRDLLAKLRRERETVRVAVESVDVTRIGDSTFNFAVTGFHIVDWLRELNPALHGPARSIIAADHSLQACHDICTASKHFRITKYNPTTVDVFASAGPVTSDGMAAAFGRVKIEMSDGTKLELLQFADAVVDAWERFFAQHKL